MGRFSKLVESALKASEPADILKTPTPFDPNKADSEMVDASMKKDTYKKILPNNPVADQVQDAVNSQRNISHRLGSPRPSVISGTTDIRDGMQHSAQFVQLGFSNASTKVF